MCPKLQVGYSYYQIISCLIIKIIDNSFFGWFIHCLYLYGLHIFTIPSVEFSQVSIPSKSHSIGSLSAAFRMLMFTFYLHCDFFQVVVHVVPVKPPLSQPWLIPVYSLLKSILLSHQNCFSRIDLLRLTTAPKFFKKS